MQSFRKIKYFDKTESFLIFLNLIKAKDDNEDDDLEIMGFLFFEDSSIFKQRIF